MSVITTGVFTLMGIQGNQTSISFNINNVVSNDLEETISKFASDALSKLKTTKRKLKDIENLYHNIFTKMIKGGHGTICLIVDKDFKDKIEKQDKNFSKLFKALKNKKYLFNCTQYCKLKLEKEGIKQIEILNFDTYTNSNLFFSNFI